MNIQPRLLSVTLAPSAITIHKKNIKSGLAPTDKYKICLALGKPVPTQTTCSTMKATFSP